RLAQAVQIDVDRRKSFERVALEEREGRTAHGTCVASPCDESAGERRLACPELAFEIQDGGSARQRRQRAPERRTEALHLLGRARQPSNQRFTHVLSSRATSLARSPRSPPPRAATSPLMACTSTATRAACHGSPHCAKMPAVAPVSTSP